jgi:hypothetical protein
MDTFNNLWRKLDPFERNYFSVVSAVPRASLPPRPIYGAVQFVAIQFVAIQSVRSCDFNARYPVVVAVGSNYTQSHRAVRQRRFTPFLTDACGNPTIVDPVWGMQQATKFSLESYRRNGPRWLSPKAISTSPHAKGRLPIPVNQDFILVAANLSPFITTIPWGNIPPSVRQNILGIWPYTNHLHGLFQLIGNNVDLWIGHGRCDPLIWITFKSWVLGLNIANWMTTFNLSGLGLRAMRNAQSNPTQTYYPLFR